MNKMYITKEVFIVINFILIMILIFLIYIILNGFLTKDFICPKELSFYEYFRVKIGLIT